MKKTYFLTLFVFALFSLMAQVPQGVNYQTVVRNSSGSIIANQNVGFRFSVRTGSPNGSIVYRETHTATTNTLGIVNLVLGQGTPQQGVFSSINWGASSHYLSVEFDVAGGTNYSLSGTSELLSVPYALFAGDALNAWSLTGNAGTNSSTNFIGTTDNVPFTIRVNNVRSGYIDSARSATFFGFGAGKNDNSTTNSAFGHRALHTNTFGGFNTAMGLEALFSNSSGDRNTAIGSSALFSNTTGSSNTAIGNDALRENTSGEGNTAVGGSTLRFNTNGGYNIAMGSFALYNNTTGSENTAIGIGALQSSRTGNRATAIGTGAMQFANNTTTGFDNINVAIGFEALRGSTTASANTGNNNTALGYETLTNNTSGSYNTATGWLALFRNTTGNDNTGIGANVLSDNTTGSSNTATGMLSLRSNTTGNFNTANGKFALSSTSTGANNTAIGYSSGFGSVGIDYNQCTFVGAQTSLSVARTNVTMLGFGIANAQSTANNQVLLGNTSVTSIRAQVNGITAYSDARFKLNVKDDIKGLDFIMKLKPVTYNENPEILHRIWGTPDSLLSNIDHSQIKQQRFIGFLAQEVEKAAKESGFDFPGIDVPKNEKEVYSLRYVDFIMPMVKAMQEQNQLIEALKKRIEVLEAK